MAEYPGALKTFTVKTNGVDKYDAAHVNTLQEEVAAVQTELGTDPAGSCTDLKTRLYVSTDNDGAMRKGTSFPASPIDGQPFYRTDENVAYIYDGSTWQPQSGVTTYAAGDYVLTPKGKMFTGTEASYTKKDEIYLPRAGTLRVKFSLKSSSSSYSAVGRIYRNGSAVGTERATPADTSTHVFSEDISGWSAGDLLQLYLYAQPGATYTSGELELFENVPVRELRTATYYPY